MVNPGEDGSGNSGLPDGPQVERPRGGQRFTSSVSLPIAEKLRGRENYSSWAFGMKMVLIREGSWSAVDVPEGAVVDDEASLRALSTICLGIEPINYSLVQEAKTASEAWKNLKSAFQDSGMTRRMGLLRKLTSIRLAECKSVEEYVNEIMSTSHKLAEVGFKVDDTWLASLLLMGLPENYEPMIMGLEASGTKISADAVKAKILQDVKMTNVPKSCGSDGAFVSNFQKKPAKKDKSNVKCFKCKRIGHFASECSQRSVNDDPGAGSHRKKNSRNAAFSVDVKQSKDKEEWIFDSGDTVYMCRNRNKLVGDKEVSQAINVANNAEVPVVAVGNVHLEAAVQDSPCEVSLSNVLCVPDLAINLLSVSQICKKGHKVIFTSDACKVFNIQTNELVAMGSQTNGLYHLEMVNQATACAARNSQEMNLWHRRLGHMFSDNMKRLKSMVTGLNFKDEKTSNAPCVPCI